MRFFLLLVPLLAVAQIVTGELRVTITDAMGLPVQASVDLVSEVNQYRRSLEAGEEGRVVAKRLPFGLYTAGSFPERRSQNLARRQAASSSNSSRDDADECAGANV